MKTATQEQVINYLTRVVGNAKLRKSYEDQLEQIKNSIAALLVENEIQRLEPADLADKTEEEKEEWREGSKDRIAQYDTALRERAMIASMLEDKIAGLPNPDGSDPDAPTPINRAERRRRDKALAKKMEDNERA